MSIQKWFMGISQLLLIVVGVEYIMLCDEDKVEEQADIAQAKLWDVSVDAAPVVLKARIYQ